MLCLCCLWAFSSFEEQELLLVDMCRLLCGDIFCFGARAIGLRVSIVVVPGLSCSVACGIFPDQGVNPCFLHWQPDSLPLSHQGSPTSPQFSVPEIWFPEGIASTRGLGKSSLHYCPSSWAPRAKKLARKERNNHTVRSN